MPVKHNNHAILMPTNKPDSYSPELLTVRGIIRAARGTRTQEAYAAELGIRQDLLCKYERGKINPPTGIIERCMRDVHILDKRRTPSARIIAERIKADLAAPELEPVRAAIANLLDVLTTTQRQQHASR